MNDQSLIAWPSEEEALKIMKAAFSKHEGETHCLTAVYRALKTHMGDASARKDEGSEASYQANSATATSSAHTLIGCPICGGEADLFECDGATGDQYYCACAPDCSIKGCVRQDTTYARKAEAIAAWNKRAVTSSEISDDGKILETLENDITNLIFHTLQYKPEKGTVGKFRSRYQGFDARDVKKIVDKIKPYLKREYRPHPDTKMSIRIKNAIHRLNLDRSDIAALPDGATILRNISDDRYMAALLTDILAKIEDEAGK